MLFLNVLLLYAWRIPAPSRYAPKTKPRRKVLCKKPNKPEINRASKGDIKKRNIISGALFKIV